MSGGGSQQGTLALFHEDSGRPERTAGMWLALELSTNGVHEAMGLCVLTTSLRKPNGRRYSRRTAAGLAAGRGYQRKPSCCSPPCWQSVHEPRSAKHVVTEITAHSGSDVEPRSMLWWRLWRGSSWTCQRRCRPGVRGSKKLAARLCQCGPDQTGSDVVAEKMCTRELQSWRDSAAADWMPSKPKPHRHRRTLSRRGRHSLRVGTGICPLALGQPIKFPTQNNFSWMPTNNNMVCPVHLPNVTVASQGISGVTWP